MLKKILLVIALLCLCSCATYNKELLISDLDNRLSNIEEYSFKENNLTDYYSYYLPSDCQEIAYEVTNFAVSYNESRMVFNINVASLVSSIYYPEYTLVDEGFFDENKILYTNSGKYTDINKETISYILNIYDYGDYHLIHLYSNNINAYAYSLKEETLQTVLHMFMISRGVNIKEDMFLANFSGSDTELFERKQVDLFQYIIPEEGYLSDLLINANK